MRTPAEETAPQQTTEVVETQPQTAMEISMAPYMSEVNSISQQIDDLQKQQGEARAEEEARLKKMQEARQKGMSLFGTLVEKQKPVYDENKEKRMRNAAIIQSLGDVLSAAARGYFAYNKKGAGVVPKAPMSNAFEGVQKINEMQNKYLNEKKAWDALDLQWKKQQADADAEAAEALYTSAKEARKEIAKRIDGLRERGIKITDGIRDAVAEQVMKEYNDARETEEAKQYQLWLRENKLGQYAPSKAKSGGGGSYAKQAATQKIKEENEKLKVWGRVYDTDPKDMLSVEKERALSEYDSDIKVIVFNVLLSEGVSSDEALSKIRNIGNEKILREFYTEWANGEGNVTLSELITDLSDTMDYTESFYE